MRQSTAFQASVFDKLFNFSRLRESEARELVEVHRSTWSRWRDLEVRAPIAALKLLEIHATGEPPGMGQEWQGWSFGRGLLHAPNGDSFTPGDLLALRIWQAQAKQLEIEHKRGVVQYLLPL